MDINNPNFISFISADTFRVVQVLYIGIGRPPSVPAPPTAPSVNAPWADAPSARKYNEQTYDYKVPLDVEIAEGDLVVVPVGDTGAMQLAQVLAVHDSSKLDFTSGNVYKWIIQKVDFNKYVEIQEREARFRKEMERVERARQLQRMQDEIRLQFTGGGLADKAFQNAMKELGVDVPSPPVKDPQL